MKFTPAGLLFALQLTACDRGSADDNRAPDAEDTPGGAMGGAPAGVTGGQGGSRPGGQGGTAVAGTGGTASGGRGSYDGGPHDGPAGGLPGSGGDAGTGSLGGRGTAGMTGTGGSGVPGEGLRALAEARKRPIYIGASVNPPDYAKTINEMRNREIIRKDFNRLGGGSFKMVLVQPQRGVLNWAPTDELVAFARAHDIAVHGHVLVYDLSTPSWLTKLSMVEVEHEMLEYIKAVVSRYKGKVHAWEVVNETITNVASPDVVHKNTIFFNAMGEAFIDKAFAAARSADPDVELLINDNDRLVDGSVKIGKYYELVKRLLSRKVPLSGVGFQGHFFTNNAPDFAAYGDWFIKFAALGVRIYWTELDVGIPGLSSGTLPSAQDLAAQAGIFEGAVKVCLAQPACVSTQFWGYRDDLMWRAPNGHALLYTGSLVAKPARDAVAGALGAP